MQAQGDVVSNEALIATLKDLEVFRGLEQSQLAALVKNAERVVFRAGQPILTAGKPGDGAYLLVAGEAEVVSDEAGPMSQAVRPGTLLGELAMLIEHDYRITVESRSTVRALKFTREAMIALMTADRQLTNHFIDRISARLSRIAVELRRVDEMLALAAQPAEA